MNDLTAHLKTVVRISVYGFIVCLLLWVLLPEIRIYAAGFVLGALVSLINAHLLAYKITMLGKQIVERTGKRVNLGFLSRICMCLIAVMLADKSVWIDLAATIAGFFYASLATLVIGLVSRARN